MICKEVMRKLEERWNPSYALEWDNVGLLPASSGQSRPAWAVPASCTGLG